MPASARELARKRTRSLAGSTASVFAGPLSSAPAAPGSQSVSILEEEQGSFLRPNRTEARPIRERNAPGPGSLPNRTFGPLPGARAANPALNAGHNRQLPPDLIGALRNLHGPNQSPNNFLRGPGAPPQAGSPVRGLGPGVVKGPRGAPNLTKRQQAQAGAGRDAAIRLVNEYRVAGYGPEITQLVKSLQAQSAAADTITTERAPLGGGRTGTTPLKFGGQGANALLGEAESFLQNPDPAATGRSGVIANAFASELDAINTQRDINTVDRNRTLSFTTASTKAQRRQIALNNQIASGRRGRGSSSVRIPLAAGLLVGRANRRVL